MGGAYSIHRNFIVRAVSELTRRDSSSPRRLGVVISEPLSREDRAKRDSRARITRDTEVKSILVYVRATGEEKTRVKFKPNATSRCN